VTIAALEQVLASPDGGLKGIPPAARRVVLLNQADSAPLQAQAKWLAKRLLGAYQAVLVAALNPPAAVGGVMPERGIFAVHEPAAGILLAAGGASRLGRPKQILEWRGEPLVRHAARAGLAAGLDPLIVVTGHAAEAVQAAQSELPVRIVHNADWNAGQSTSVIAGLRAAPPESGAAVFLLADQPRVPPALVRGLIDAHAVSLAPIVAPLVDGQRANPVLFDRVTFPELLSLSGDTGGRALFSRYPVSWFPWHDSLAALDVDTPADYERLLEQGKEEPG
jgi:molybdenum cofactor cytidylyltransferase